MTRNDRTKDIYFRADGTATDFFTLARESGASPEVIAFAIEDDRKVHLQERYDRENTDMRFETLTRRAEEHGTGEPWAYIPSGDPSPEDVFFATVCPTPTTRDMVLEVAGSLPPGQAEFVYMIFAADFMRDIARELGSTEQAVHSRFLKVSRTLRKRIGKAHPESIHAGV